MAVSAHEPEGGAASSSIDSQDAKPAKKGGLGRGMREFIIIVVIALVISALVRAFLVQAFYVPSASMLDTLQINDRILASRISTTVGGTSRGEIVVFKDPGGWLPPPPEPADGLRGIVTKGLTFIGVLPADSGQDLVKRVIATGGDRIACCDEQGRIVLNGVPLNENYIIGPTDQVFFDVTIPDGGIFVMGDNRGDSRDSRFHLDVNNGAVPTDNVVGRVVFVVWPLARWAFEGIPAIFEDPNLN